MDASNNTLLTIIVLIDRNRFSAQFMPDAIDHTCLCIAQRRINLLFLPVFRFFLRLYDR